MEIISSKGIQDTFNITNNILGINSDLILNMIKVYSNNNLVEYISYTDYLKFAAEKDLLNPTEKKLLINIMEGPSEILIDTATMNSISNFTKTLVNINYNLKSLKQMNDFNGISSTEIILPSFADIKDRLINSSVLSNYKEYCMCNSFDTDNNSIISMTRFMLIQSKFNLIPIFSS